jgi:hypothetical protein
MKTRKTSKATVANKLKKAGVKTMADLDRWVMNNPLPNGDLTSRYDALKRIVGENAAMWMMNELAIRQCC